MSQHQKGVIFFGEFLFTFHSKINNEIWVYWQPKNFTSLYYNNYTKREGILYMSSQRLYPNSKFFNKHTCRIH